MRMLMPKRSTREMGGPSPEPAESLDGDRVEAVQADRQQATKALGARQELLGGTLEEIARLSGHLRRLDEIVGELRSPLEEEMVAHRHELGELITTRALLDQTSERLQQSRDGERSLANRVASLELALEGAHNDRHARDLSLQDVSLELDRLRTALTETEARAENSALALRDANLRMRQLDEDLAFMRKQSQEDDSFRREIDALLARASQESLLLEEEAGTLRRRLEQTTSEAFRLSSVESELQAQLANERARLIALQAATERAQGELLQLKGQAEEQAAAARSEIAALSTRLETSGARANRLEVLNADLARRVSEATSRHRSDERRVSEVHTAGERTAERAAAVEEELAAQRNANAALERARLAALERADQLGKLLQSHELTMRRAEERLRDMQTKLDASQTEQDTLRKAGEQASTDAATEVERLRADLAIAEAALKTAQEDRSRQHLSALSGGPIGGTGRPRSAIS